jgi:hypothetical protein
MLPELAKLAESQVCDNFQIVGQRKRFGRNLYPQEPTLAASLSKNSRPQSRPARHMLFWPTRHDSKV